MNTSKRNRNKTIKNVALGTTVALSLFLVVLRFKNPDITDVRFFLEYWFFILSDVVFATITLGYFNDEQ